METFTTKIIEHSGLKYRIEIRNNQGIWQQRHIWYPAPATFVSQETAEGWIRGLQTPPDPARFSVRHPKPKSEATGQRD